MASIFVKENAWAEAMARGTEMHELKEKCERYELALRNILKVEHSYTCKRIATEALQYPVAAE